MNKFANNTSKISLRCLISISSLLIKFCNVDETGVTTVQDPKEVVTPTGMKNVGAITSGERGELVTAVYAICAAGYALAPILIYPRVHKKDAFIRGAPPGTIEKATKSGWINEGLFGSHQ